MKDLFQKYDVPAPRYTSYPTVPYWSRTPSSEEWLADVTKAAGRPGAECSIYLHLPFCENHCAFCACNTVTTADHAVEQGYIRALHGELDLYLQQVPRLKGMPVRQFHIGGGTPTFFSASSMEALLLPFRHQLAWDGGSIDASVEVNPVYVNSAQLKTLHASGFRRLSIGVQDFDPQVQAKVGRIQPLKVTQDVLNMARRMGYDSINFDLIYGMPGQSKESMRQTAQTTVELRPDRIALYSLALVPWIKPAHKQLAESAPRGAEKRMLYEICRNAFLEAGYMEIGMDHFALPSDSLAKAARDGTLHRNFMGYTDRRSSLLLAFGASAISQSPGCYHQNEKAVDNYQAAIARRELATSRGHIMTEQDMVRQRQILDVMTRFEVVFDDQQHREKVKTLLQPLIEDGLIVIEERLLRITLQGRPFLRNVCIAFDERLQERSPETKIFSQAV